MSILRSLAITPFTAWLLSACCPAHSPVCCQVPPYEALETAIEKASAYTPFDPTDTLPCDWWVIFNDPQLSGYIEQALACSPTSQAAHMRILSAAYRANAIRAGLYPYLNEMTSSQYNVLSKTALVPTNTPSPNQPIIGPGIPFEFTLDSSALNLTWDLDLWDKIRNRVRAACGEVQANIADEAFTRLNLSIAVADVYFKLQILNQRREIAQNRVKNRFELLNLIKKRVFANLEGTISQERAEIDLNAAERDLLIVQGQVEVLQHQLQVYLADSFQIPIEPVVQTAEGLPRVPLPCDLPLHLLSRRPDIASQLWLIYSAGRQIEVAQAGFYPDVNLTGLAGFQTIHLEQWFNANSFYAAVGPAVTLPIFTGGLLTATLSKSEVDYDLAILEYNSLVLKAAQDALDGITLVKTTSDILMRHEADVKHQDKIVHLMQRKQHSNLASSFDVLTTQQVALEVQDAELIALGDNLHAILGLVKAMGGGYETCIQ